MLTNNPVCPGAMNCLNTRAVGSIVDGGGIGVTGGAIASSASDDAESKKIEELEDEEDEEEKQEVNNKVTLYL